MSLTSSRSEEEVKRLFGLLEEVKKRIKLLFLYLIKLEEALQLAGPNYHFKRREKVKLPSSWRQDISEEDVIFYKDTEKNVLERTNLSYN